MDKLDKITVSAPGKLILMGEHSVVYGHPCLVTSVAQYLTISVLKIPQKKLVLNSCCVDVENYHKPISDLTMGDVPIGARFVETAVRNFFQAYPDDFGISVETVRHIGHTYGFGSSSAVTVCIIYALSELSGLKLNRKKLFDLSFKTVTDVQHAGSGFDIASAIWGGSLYYVTGGKIIEPLNIPDLPLVVGYTGVKADTCTLIKQVAEKRKNESDKVSRIFAAITQLVDEAIIYLKKGDYQRAGRLFDFNQDYLRNLGVSTQKLEDLISAAKKAGATGAKLSGAGGGDCMIAITPDHKKQAVADAITGAGGIVIDVKTNAEGVRIENDR
jgi:mevalonate kinase